MRKTIIFLVTILFYSELFSQQLVIKLNEGFESNTFPPQGWKKINIMGANQWQRLTAPLPSIISKPPIQGNAVARINMENTGGEDWLITKKINSIETGDSLIFYLIKQYDSGPYPPDSLLIRISTTDSIQSNFTNIILNINIAGIPTGTQEWRRYSLPLEQFDGQNIFIAFQHKDVNGHGCAIDSIVVFNPNSIGISKISNNIPDKFKLFQNYPNPFNPKTIIRFQINETKFIVLKVFDILGREITTLINEKLQPGTYEIPFSIYQYSKNKLASEVYFYRFESDEFADTKKMILIK
ncbi:MAG: choice-of-anchor J domain-containing protein [Ignavibacteria bacterium]|jgi:hypothetical protein